MIYGICSHSDNFVIPKVGKRTEKRGIERVVFKDTKWKNLVQNFTQMLTHVITNMLKEVWQRAGRKTNL